ncbi:MAG: GNAT family N-acetyltransferase [Rhizobiaceae bacterium]
MDKAEPNLEFTISIASSADVVDMAILLGGIFSKSEPPAVAAGFPASKIEELAKVFGEKSVRENLSVVARSSDTGDTVGALLAHDFGTPPPDEIGPLVPTFEPLLAFLGQLEDKYRTTHTIAEGDFVHVFMIAVDDAWSGKGIAQQLLQACMSNGASNGYRFALTEATSDLSRHVFRNIGFQELHFASYEDFEFQGTRPFASISDHKGCALMEMKIT